MIHLWCAWLLAGSTWLAPMGASLPMGVDDAVRSPAPASPDAAGPSGGAALPGPSPAGAPHPGRAEPAPVGAGPDEGGALARFRSRAVKMVAAPRRWWEVQRLADGDVRFFGPGGEELEREAALRAAGAPGLADRQAAVDLVEQTLPFAVAVPLVLGPFVGLALGGGYLGVQGKRFEEILALGWATAFVGLVVGGLLAAGGVSFGLFTVGLLRIEDDDAVRLVARLNRRVAEEVGLPEEALPVGYVEPVLVEPPALGPVGPGERR